MKIELINENQIRCTLTLSDLADRHLKLSELAFGSEKARLLFQEMMNQAYQEYGFEAENIPLMVEARPVSAECIILVVTKVSSPEDIDERISRYQMLQADSDSGFLTGREGDGEKDSSLLPDIGGILERLFSDPSSGDSSGTSDSHGKEDPMEYHSPCFFSFDSMEDTVFLCRLILPFFKGDSSLYRDPEEKVYYLVLETGDGDKDNFTRACGLASDFGSRIMTVPGSHAFFQEHFTAIAEGDAASVLASL